MPAEGRGGCQVAISSGISAFAQGKEEQMQTKIDRIRELSKKNRNRKFMSLYHLINEKLLLECCRELDPDKATGIDGVDKELYVENVSGNIMELADKLKDKSYQPNPTKRVYIPKDNGDIIFGRQNGTDGSCENNRGNIWAGIFTLYL